MMAYACTLIATPIAVGGIKTMPRAYVAETLRGSSFVGRTIRHK